MGPNTRPDVSNLDLRLSTSPIYLHTPEHDKSSWVWGRPETFKSSLVVLKNRVLGIKYECGSKYPYPHPASGKCQVRMYGINYIFLKVSKVESLILWINMKKKCKTAPNSFGLTLASHINYQLMFFIHAIKNWKFAYYLTHFIFFLLNLKIKLMTQNIVSLSILK